MKITQTQQVIEVMKRLGGFATFGKLNSEMDFSSWKTKTPEATVRRIVQDNQEFFKIKPGLWALKENEKEILSKFNLQNNDNNNEADNKFTHSFYQGLTVEIGNLEKMDTFVPNQDKNKFFLDKPLKDIANLQEIYQFTYPEIVKRAKTVDVIWFNERCMPYAFFEIEHSTDIQNSLLKFYDLQDFNSKFYIIADKRRQKKFDELINRNAFKDIKKRVEFKNYDAISELHTKTYERAKCQSL